jgi:hypothetical protein
MHGTGEGVLLALHFAGLGGCTRSLSWQDAALRDQCSPVSRFGRRVMVSRSAVGPVMLAG